MGKRIRRAARRTKKALKRWLQRDAVKMRGRPGTRVDVAEQELARHDSFSECRTCLEPGVVRECCGNYYCNACFYKYRACPSCDTTIDREDIKTIAPPSTAKGLRWALAFVLCFYLFLFATVPALIVRHNALPVTVFGQTCAGVLWHEWEWLCIKRSDFLYTQDPRTQFWGRCENGTEIGCVCGHACKTNQCLYDTGSGLIGVDIVRDTFLPAEIIMQEEFVGGINGSYWRNITNGVMSSTCGTVTGNQTLRFRGEGARIATTADFDVRHGGELEFHLIYGSGQPGCAALEVGMVTLDYSVDRGQSWTEWKTFDRNTYRQDNFTHVRLTLPANATSPNTAFRFYQKEWWIGFDVWALDAMKVFAYLEPDWETSDSFKNFYAAVQTQELLDECCMDCNDCMRPHEIEDPEACNVVPGFQTLPVRTALEQEMLVLLAGIMAGCHLAFEVYTIFKRSVLTLLLACVSRLVPAKFDDNTRRKHARWLAEKPDRVHKWGDMHSLVGTIGSRHSVNSNARTVVENSVDDRTTTLQRPSGLAGPSRLTLPSSFTDPLKQGSRTRSGAGRSLASGALPGMMEGVMPPPGVDGDSFVLGGGDSGIRAEPHSPAKSHTRSAARSAALSPFPGATGSMISDLESRGSSVLPPGESLLPPDMAGDTYLAGSRVGSSVGSRKKRRKRKPGDALRRVRMLDSVGRVSTPGSIGGGSGVSVGTPARAISDRGGSKAGPETDSGGEGTESGALPTLADAKAGGDLDGDDYVLGSDGGDGDDDDDEEEDSDTDTEDEEAKGPGYGIEGVEDDVELNEEFGDEGSDEDTEPRPKSRLSRLSKALSGKLSRNGARAKSAKSDGQTTARSVGAASVETPYRESETEEDTDSGDGMSEDERAEWGGEIKKFKTYRGPTWHTVYLVLGIGLPVVLAVTWLGLLLNRTGDFVRLEFGIYDHDSVYAWINLAAVLCDLDTLLHVASHVVGLTPATHTSLRVERPIRERDTDLMDWLRQSRLVVDRGVGRKPYRVELNNIKFVREAHNGEFIVVAICHLLVSQPTALLAILLPPEVRLWALGFSLISLAKIVFGPAFMFKAILILNQMNGMIYSKKELKRHNFAGSCCGWRCRQGGLLLGCRYMCWGFAIFAVYMAGVWFLPRPSHFRRHIPEMLIIGGVGICLASCFLGCILGCTHTLSVHPILSLTAMHRGVLVYLSIPRESEMFENWRVCAGDPDKIPGTGSCVPLKDLFSHQVGILPEEQTHFDIDPFPRQEAVLYASVSDYKEFLTNVDISAILQRIRTEADDKQRRENMEASILNGGNLDLEIKKIEEILAAAKKGRQDGRDNPVLRVSRAPKKAYDPYHRRRWKEKYKQYQDPSEDEHKRLRRVLSRSLRKHHLPDPTPPPGFTPYARDHPKGKKPQRHRSKRRNAVGPRG